MFEGVKHQKCAQSGVFWYFEGRRRIGYYRHRRHAQTGMSYVFRWRRIVPNTENTPQGVFLVFGDGGNTRHIKHAHLDAFYVLGGEPNTKYMPRWA